VGFFSISTAAIGREERQTNKVIYYLLMPIQLNDVETLRQICTVAPDGYIDLSPVWGLINTQANAQEDYKKEKGTYKASRKYSPENWITGVAGEVAFSIICGQPVDTNIYKHGIAYGDFADGMIEIKVTKWAPPIMKEFMNKKPKVKGVRYVSGHVDLRRKAVKFFGWLTYEELLSRGTVQDFGYGNRITASIQILNDMATVFDGVNYGQGLEF